MTYGDPQGGEHEQNPQNRFVVGPLALRFSGDEDHCTMKLKRSPRSSAVSYSIISSSLNKELCLKHIVCITFVHSAIVTS